MKISEILDQLEIPANNSIVFFHIAANKISHFCDSNVILREIENYFADTSTICLPSYPFFGRREYVDYIEGNPVFNVKKTPCRVNLLCEIFRRQTGVKRSIHPWCPVAAKGAYAEEIVSEHHKSKHVFGEKTPFGKIMNNNGFVVGLGVNCNTNSFAHLPDDEMLSDYSFDVYEKENKFFDCIGYNNEVIKVETNLLEKNIMRIIKPVRMEPFFKNEDFYRGFKIDEADFYRMNIKKFVRFTVEFNREIVKETGKPIYYELFEISNHIRSNI
jgi:aminoglycoside N3'-acetyltransferase